MSGNTMENTMNMHTNETNVHFVNTKPLPSSPSLLHLPSSSVSLPPISPLNNSNYSLTPTYPYPTSKTPPTISSPTVLPTFALSSHQTQNIEVIQRISPIPPQVFKNLDPFLNTLRLPFPPLSNNLIAASPNQPIVAGSFVSSPTQTVSLPQKNVMSPPKRKKTTGSKVIDKGLSPEKENSNPRTRNGNWELYEMGILNDAKHEEFLQSPEKSAKAKFGSKVEKWEYISEALKERGVQRDWSSCEKKWNNLNNDYKKIRDYGSKSGVALYFSMTKKERSENGLATSFSQFLFEKMDSWMSKRDVINPKVTWDTGDLFPRVNTEYEDEEDTVMLDSNPKSHGVNENGTNAGERPSEEATFEKKEEVGEEDGSEKKRASVGSPPRGDEFMTGRKRKRAGRHGKHDNPAFIAREIAEKMDKTIEKSNNQQFQQQKESNKEQFENQNKLLDKQFQQNQEIVGAIGKMFNEVISAIAANTEKIMNG